ncbi:MAG: alpha/beta hydrolase family protein [Spirochaetota bacterium]
MTLRSSAIIAMLLLMPIAGACPREASFEQQLSPADTDAFIAPLFEGSPAPAARYAVDVYELFVETRHPSGTTTPVRVQLFVPAAEPGRLRGSYLFAAGSTGLINPCRVSREHLSGIRWGLYRAHVLSLAGQGYIGILPDYMGYEDWDLIQPYFHAESEARLMVDVTEAVHAVLADRIPGGLRSMTRVAAGYSQGGHAVFAAADRNDEFPDGLEIDGLVGYGPTTAVDALFLEYPSVAPMVVQAYRTIYGDEAFDPLDILAEPWASSLAYDTTRQCVGGLQSYYPDRATKLFRIDFMKSLWARTLAVTHPGVHRIMQANRAGMAGHGIPALILQGTDDVVVDRRTQDEFVTALRERGSDVRYLVYEGARHDTRQISWPAVIDWIDSLP